MVEESRRHPSQFIAAARTRRGGPAPGRARPPRPANDVEHFAAEQLADQGQAALAAEHIADEGQAAFAAEHIADEGQAAAAEDAAEKTGLAAEDAAEKT